MLAKKDQKILKLGAILRDKENEIKNVEELLHLAMENMTTPNTSDLVNENESQFQQSTKNQGQIVKMVTTKPQIELLPQTPGQASDEAKKKWNELGILSLEEIFANSESDIDRNLKFGQSKTNKYLMG